MSDCIEETKARISGRMNLDAKRFPLLVAKWQAETLPLARKEERFQLRRLIDGMRADRKSLKRWEAMG